MIRLLFWLVATSITLAGCAGNSVPTRYYTLKADGRPPVSAASLPAATTLGIGPLELPEILDRVGIVSRKKQNELNISSYNIWAGDLRDTLLRVLADNLSNQLGHDRVWTFPWDNRNRPEYQLRIIIEEFSGKLGDQAVLRAKWSLLGARGRTELFTRRSRYQQTIEGNGYGDYIEALNLALNAFSGDLANQVKASLGDSAIPVSSMITK